MGSGCIPSINVGLIFLCALNFTSNEAPEKVAIGLVVSYRRNTLEDAVLRNSHGSRSLVLRNGQRLRWRIYIFIVKRFWIEVKNQSTWLDEALEARIGKH